MLLAAPAVALMALGVVFALEGGSARAPADPGRLLRAGPTPAEERPPTVVLRSVPPLAFPGVSGRRDAAAPRRTTPRTTPRHAAWEEPLGEELRAELGRLAAELRDDDVAWNATGAAWDLERIARRSPAARQAVWDVLHPLCASGDAQQRDLCVALCIELTRDRGPTLAPGHALLDAAADWLVEPPRFESLFYGLAWERTIGLFALDHVDDMESRLVRRLDAPGAGSPLEPAFVLGASGRTVHADRIAPILIDALRSNEADADACMATEALVALGVAALPYLESAAASEDEQQRLSIEAIRREIVDPSRSAQDDEDRAELNVLTAKYPNAARQWRYRRSFRRYLREE